MKKLLLTVLLLVYSQPIMSQEPFLQGQLIDLTHPFDESTIYWPTEENFQLEKEFSGMTEKKYFYSANRFCTAEHGGTHIDAPVHFSKTGRTVDQIPLEQLIGNGILIDVSSSCAKNPDYLISINDLENWEKQHGTIPPKSIILFRTGFSKHWPNRKKYLGTEERGKAAVAKLHFPGLSSEAAQWLIEKRSIKAVGLDTASIDYGQSTHFKTHQMLGGKNIPAFENLASLEKLPAKNFTIIALPMKIAQGSGGPLRIVAVLK